jgi:hypothetical protein
MEPAHSETGDCRVEPPASILVARLSMSHLVPLLEFNQPGELFSSPLFPGLAIDPAWIVDYPDEINLIRKFSPQIRVLRDPDEPQLTKRARKMTARIAEHFGEKYSPRLSSQGGIKGASQAPRTNYTRITPA